MNDLFKNYLSSLFKFAGIKAPVFLFVITLGSLIQGVGILMLIPMLNVWLNSNASVSTTPVSHAVTDLLAFFNLPLTLPVILIAYILIVALQSCLKRYQSVLSAEIIQGYSRYQYSRIYRSISHAQWLFIARNRASDITHVLTSEIQKVVSGTQFLLLFISSVFIGCVHLGLAFYISIPMTIAGVICGGLLLVLQLPKNKLSYNTGKAVVTNKRYLYSEISEYLGGMKTAKSYGAENRHIDSFNRLVSEIEFQKVNYARARAGIDFIYEVGFVTAISIVFYSAVTYLHMQVTELIVMVYVFSRLLPSISRLHQYYLNMMNMLPSFEAVTDLYEKSRKAIEKQQPIPQGKEKITQSIELKDIRFSYAETTVLDDITIYFPVRSVTALSGVSGAGKTTLADILMGLLPPDAGQLLVDGRPVNGNMHAWRNSIGYVPQDTFLFHDTIRANLKWARPDASDTDILAALASANADSLIAKLPEGLDTIVGDRGGSLSGGERQRIALARALLRNPYLLLLDEATSALDPENEQNILKTIKELSKELTVVIISHRESTINVADRVVFLENGRIVKTSNRVKNLTRQ